MSEERMDELLGAVRDVYHPPPDTPAEEMWAALEPGLGPRTAGVVDLAAERRRRAATPVVGWAAAAAAVLVLGIGIGRMTAPATGVPGAEPAPAGAVPNLSYAAAEHLGRSESLLTMVRTDGADGRLDPQVAGWARGLLTQTRLLLDREGTTSPVMEELMRDLELVLVQIVGVTEQDGGEVVERRRTELDLALRGLERREVLARIRAVVPAGGPSGGPSLSGT